MNIQQIKSRALELAQATEKNSISPNDVFGLHAEIADKVKHNAEALEELAESVDSIQEDINNVASSYEVDADKGWLTTEVDGRRFFAQLTELVKPAAPTIAVSEYTVVSGNVSVEVTNNATGATLKYSTDGGYVWTETTGTVSLASGFTNSMPNGVDMTYSLWVKAVKNGEDSDITKVTITIHPKVAPGSVTVVRTPNDNNWATSAAITLTPSPTSGATSEYSTNGGSTWTVFTAARTETVSASQTANMYKVRAKKANYADADVKGNSAFTLNAKKAYYGFSTSTTLANAAAITALASTGGSEEATELQGAKVIRPTGNAAGYVWLCCTGTLAKDSIVANAGDVIPFGFNAAVTVNGWNCYRCTNAINPENTNVYIP